LLAAVGGVSGCGEPKASPEPEGAVPGECDDRADNDQDGLFDCADEGCAAGPDCNENQVSGDCGDGADNDADGAFDCADADCASDASCVIPPEDACDDGADNDADGAFDCADSDCAGLDGCDDFEGDGVGECTDGRDNDGDGSVDCDDANCAGSPDCAAVVIDVDGDGVAAELDCDDGDAAVFPGATEVCDAVDSDCDGSVADAFADFDGDDAPDCVDAPLPGDGLAHPTLGTLRYIPAGTFTMGCVAGRDDVAGGCEPDESPAHDVTLTQAFWMMESELTQAMWSALGYVNPSWSLGSNRPLETVTWWEAVEVANALSAADGLGACYVPSGCSGAMGSGRTCGSVAVVSGCEGWRLPTEAEWEYAARAGSDFAYAGSDQATNVGWFADNSTGVSAEVCRLQSNGFGLCDLTGNVWEWVADWYATYSLDEVEDPRGPNSGVDRVIRGGSFLHPRPRVSNRGTWWLESDLDIGFRLVRTAP
jgi:formylglycine-generating enzyme required for sulfatase activity